MYVVYKHTAPNGKSYIGLTCQTLERRARGGRGYKECTAFYNAIMKYGWDNIKHEILESGLTFEAACERERFYISYFHSLTTQWGYNLVTGGRVGCRVSQETKKRISKILTGRIGTPHTEESKRKLREARLGKPNPPRTKEHRQKLSEALKGRKFTKEHCLNISKGKKGTQSGKRNPRARKVLCVETGVVFDTIKEAGEFINGSPKNIVSCCRGRLKTSGGYHWEYVGGVADDHSIGSMEGGTKPNPCPRRLR